ncbi:SPOR domain-containing protein [Bordetella genomosp. 11]|uniref:Cell division protein n=1 Tax=Bordetella genomosp. 11 TaxID=1416808 RepID=A0A261UWK5_9BORD|nr:SPOR domain-containing protein [Bordetella genomosp. 11]OZI66264.1 cell division protein [Bordetella genomosp. 11]
MAKRKPVKRSSERGSTLYGVLTGLLIGLIVAAAVAFYVTRAPVPFVDRASRHADQSPLPDVRNAPDPNAGLYGRDGAAGIAPTGPTATPAPPVPGAQPSTPGTGPHGPDDLGALIATLPTTPEPPPRAADKPADKATDKAADKPAAKPSAPAAVASASPSGRDSAKETGGKYFLQAGAYRAVDDAEALRARILLLGLPVAVQRAEVNGKPINRVRVGPFARLDDMNRARTRLGENKIEVAVVRQ